MKEIIFNHSTKDGVRLSKGELIEHDGFQYALHVFEDKYSAIELSTGFAVASVDIYKKNTKDKYARDYLIKQIKKNKLTPRVLERAKTEMEANGIAFPVNNRF